MTYNDLSHQDDGLKHLCIFMLHDLWNSVGYEFEFNDWYPSDPTIRVLPVVLGWKFGNVVNPPSNQASNICAWPFLFLSFTVHNSTQQEGGVLLVFPCYSSDGSNIHQAPNP